MGSLFHLPTSLPALQIKRQRLEVLFLRSSNLEDVMGTIGKVVPRQAETRDAVSLTRLQKSIGVCLLLFYLAMIVITIATLPYVADASTGAVFWPLQNSEH
jgi:hypothetical protein